ncbi:Hsp70 family protein [Paraburkholderia sp. SIMBA_054]|uniref:Hsp70 family protein n=1 Tax=Paraburkholderia sp. SIMBA_054 TaxID=3085795 RepID=UPI00397BBE71
MAVRKELFVNALQLVDVDSRTNVPSVITYHGGKALIGYEALESSVDPTLVNENFKLELGRVTPARVRPPLFDCADGKPRSANEITQDFVEALIKRASEWIAAREHKAADRIIVAEPLSLEREGNWLANYRNRMKAILQKQFKEVDFLPEPFAVFQFYRYGVKHPIVAANRKHVALVIDFGGGTFDVSVVETTATGDVSQSGRHARPLAGASIPVGGHYINRSIAKKLIADNLAKGVDRSTLTKAWNAYDMVADEEGRSFQSLRDDLKNFIRNVRKLTSEIEKAKISLCGMIRDWRLNAQFSTPPSHQIQVPTNPLLGTPDLKSVRLDALWLRDTFIDRIWKERLKPEISACLSRAQAELEGKPITVILLSGGSANIRWLEKLIEEQFAHSLPEANVLSLEANFQEIVSKGLAIECARKTFTEGTGDFQSVTYNRLCLLLASDDGHPAIYRYKPQFNGGMSDLLDDGVLLRSASALKEKIDTPLRWKVRLQSPPRRQLNYYFLRSSLDVEDIGSLHNVQHRVNTPAGAKFDGSIHVELTVSDDGTASPRFIYRQGHDDVPEIAVDGERFYIDMTAGGRTTLGEAYIGFDFGSSNSSISYVEQSAVKVYSQRAGEKGWMELNEMMHELPLCIARPLAKYISSTTIGPRNIEYVAALEAMLGFAAAVTYAEHCALLGRSKGKLLKGFDKASVGPIWALLRQSLASVGSRGTFSRALRDLVSETHHKWIDEAISAANDIKHGRDPGSADLHRALNLLGNKILTCMSGRSFGYFENVTRTGFSRKYAGLFKVARGTESHFLHALDYTGPGDFSAAEAFIIDIEAGRALSLTPFMFWHSLNGEIDPTIAVLDTIGAKGTTFKLVETGKSITLDSGHEVGELHEACVSAFEEQDCPKEILSDLQFSDDQGT